MMKSPGKVRKNIVKNMGFNVVNLIWNEKIQHIIASGVLSPWFGPSMKV